MDFSNSVIVVDDGAACRILRTQEVTWHSFSKGSRLRWSVNKIRTMSGALSTRLLHHTGKGVLTRLRPSRRIASYNRCALVSLVLLMFNSKPHVVRVTKYDSRGFRSCFLGHENIYGRFTVEVIAKPRPASTSALFFDMHTRLDVRQQSHLLAHSSLPSHGSDGHGCRRAR